MNNLLYWKKELGLNSETNKNLVILFQLLDYNHFARHFLYRPHTPFGWGKGVLCMFGFVRSLIYLLDNRRVCLTNFWGAFILFDSREWRINKMKWGRIICIVSALRCQAFSWKNKDPPLHSLPLCSHTLFRRVVCPCKILFHLTVCSVTMLP